MSYPRDEYPGKRDYICDGSHASQIVKDVEELEVYICADPTCARIVVAKCTHSIGIYPDNKTSCKWNEDGTILSCTFCGVDAT